MRISMITWGVLMVLPFCLAGCGPKAADRAAVTHPAVYFSCGPARLKAVFQNDSLTLDIDGQSHTLMSVIAASGAKYETSSGVTPHVVFWNKGREAMLEVGDTSYPTCEQTDQQVTVPTEDHLSSGAAKDKSKPSIIGTEWLAEDINNRGIIDNSHITLTLTTEGRVAGHSGCNRYGSSYELAADGRLTLNGPMVSTMMACAGGEAMMNQEHLFTDTLGKMTKAALNENGFLILSNDQGQTIRFAPMQAE